MELSSLPNLKVTLTGGSIRWPGAFSMVGATAFDSLQRLFFDKVFMGACGVHPDHGLTVIESDEALILSQMLLHSKQVIAVADSSKLGMISDNRVCNASQIHTIVTDDGIEPAIATEFRSRNIEVIVA
jgi:DeoR family transcriptional regulator of aga operon